MSKRKTQEEVEAIFKSKGCQLLSKYKNNRTKLNYLCDKSHPHSIRLDSFIARPGNGCPICLKENRKLDPEYIIDEINKSDYTYISGTYDNAHSKLLVECDVCGHQAEITWNNFKKGKGCQRCFWKNNSGENHWRFNSELSDEDRALLNKLKGTRQYDPQYNKWRLGVYRKHNYKCVKCGSNKDICAHHINSFADNPALALNVDNGVVLCREHHNEFHKIYGYGKNNEQQFKKYLQL